MNNRTILVTGGNRGIGQAIVSGLANTTGDLILLGCRNVEEGEKLASAIGNNVKAVKLDLSSQESLSSDLRDLGKEFPKIDVLINNAGILGEADILSCTEEDIESSIRVNTLAPIYLIRHILPGMVESGYGRIVNMTSGWGSFKEGLGGPFAYSVSKAALNAVTFSAAKTPYENIKINSMCPGWVRTRMGGSMANRSPEEGAETAIWLANLPEDGPTGGFFRDKNIIEW